MIRISSVPMEEQDQSQGKVKELSRYKVDLVIYFGKAEGARGSAHGM